jgi:hypothetical protein
MKGTESKADKFQRIAERRVNETIKSLRLLGNLADRRNYEYSAEQASSLVSAVDQEVRALRFKFKSDATASGRPFRFKKGV